MEEINTIKLINAVKSQPSIYDRLDPMYSNKKCKIQSWISVCEEVYPNWGSKSATERTECEIDVQKRWKNLRTCFSRELKLQRKEKYKAANNIPIKRRKMYGNFEHLTFLLNSNYLDDSDEIQPNTDEEDNDPLDNFKRETPEMDIEVEVEPKPKRRKRPSFVIEEDYQAPMFIGDDHSEDRFLGAIKEMRRDEEDEDRQFMLSLVPSFRRLNAKRKFEARIEILQVLKNISCRED